MRIYTLFIETPNPAFAMMLKAFEASVWHNSKIPLTIITTSPNYNAKKLYRSKINSNSQKLNIFNDIVQNATEDIILMDCDMILQNDISEVFDLVNDLGYTVADYPRNVPFNGGVLVVKNTEKAKSDFKLLTEINNLMINDSEFHEKYRSRFAGINQAAMGFLISNGDVTWSKLPMSIYNMAENWHNIKASAIHYKGRLQKAVFSNTIKPYPELVTLWWNYYYRHPQASMSVRPPADYRSDVIGHAITPEKEQTGFDWLNWPDSAPVTHADT
jgi:hypothetical protein